MNRSHLQQALIELRKIGYKVSKLNVTTENLQSLYNEIYTQYLENRYSELSCEFSCDVLDGWIGSKCKSALSSPFACILPEPTVKPSFVSDVTVSNQSVSDVTLYQVYHQPPEPVSDEFTTKSGLIDTLKIFCLSFLLVILTPLSVIETNFNVVTINIFKGLYLVLQNAVSFVRGFVYGLSLDYQTSKKLRSAV